MTFTWFGRQMETANVGNTAISYEYNADGLRTSKTVQKDDYAEGNAAMKYTFIPFSSGILGAIFARILLNNVDDTQIGISVLGLCLLFFSYIASIGSISFARLFVLKKLKADKSENT